MAPSSAKTDMLLIKYPILSDEKFIASNPDAIVFAETMYNFNNEPDGEEVLRNLFGTTDIGSYLERVRAGEAEAVKMYRTVIKWGIPKPIWRFNREMKT